MKINKLIIEEINKYINNIIIENILLIEATDIKDIYAKYYSDIDENIFYQIVQADPTYNVQKPNKIGKYGKWLLALYKMGNLDIEDLQKATEYLSIFIKFYNRIQNKNINKFKSLQELFSEIQPFYENQDQATSKSDEVRIIKKGAEKVYEDKEWLVVIPHTEEASCYYGEHTQWCTAAKNNNQFNEYNNEGNLYINIDKKNNKKYQFHFESNSFMDENNNPIEYPICDIMGMSNGLKKYYKSICNRENLERLGLWFDKLLSQALQRLSNGEDPHDVFDYCGDFNNGFATVNLYNKRNYIDKNNNILSKQWFDSCYQFENGIAKVELNYNKCNFINKNGKLLSKTWFEGTSQLINGFIVVAYNKKYNYMDANGKLLTDKNKKLKGQWFDECYYFNENGFARVRLNGKDYYIDTNGNLHDYIK